MLAPRSRHRAGDIVLLGGRRSAAATSLAAESNHADGGIQRKTRGRAAGSVRKKKKLAKLKYQHGVAARAKHRRAASGISWRNGVMRRRQSCLAKPARQTKSIAWATGAASKAN